MENEVRDFYNKYGIREWNRLEENIYSRINFLLHMHFIEKHLHEGMRILDAGCGAGRYSIEFAKRGCKVTLFDISDGQLQIAKDKISEAKVNENIEGILQGDIRELSQFKMNSLTWLFVMVHRYLIYLNIGKRLYLSSIGYCARTVCYLLASITNGVYSKCF